MLFYVMLCVLVYVRLVYVRLCYLVLFGVWFWWLCLCLCCGRVWKKF